MQCPSCQAECQDDAAFCQGCGARLKGGEPSRSAHPSETPPPGAERPAPRATPQQAFHASAVHAVDDPADEVEEAIWEGSYSSKAMVGQWIAAGAATVLAVVIGVMTNAWAIVLGAVVLMWAILIGWYGYKRFSVHYRLTTQRLIHESGMLWKTIDRIELIDIDDVTFKQGPVERAFRVGTIIVISGDKTSPELKLPGIDNVRSVADRLDDARRKERRRRGLHMITQGA